MPEKCVRIVLDMNGGAITQVKSSVWFTDKIPVSVGLYQGSSLIPLPFPHDYGCVGLQDKRSTSVLHGMWMPLYCVAPEERRWNGN